MAGASGGATCSRCTAPRRSVAEIVRQVACEARECRRCRLRPRQLAAPRLADARFRNGPAAQRCAGAFRPGGLLRPCSGAGWRHCHALPRCHPAARTRWRRRGACSTPAGGFGPGGDIVREGATMEAMRRGRARHNTPGGLCGRSGWRPKQASMWQCWNWRRVPARVILLMSDGFAALCDTYQLYDEPGPSRRLRGRSASRHCWRNLRHLERVEDPDAKRFARFKQCDDATAILLEIRK